MEEKKKKEEEREIEEKNMRKGGKFTCVCHFIHDNENNSIVFRLWKVPLENILGNQRV